MAIRIPIVRPELGDAEVDAASRVIRSGWLTQGPEVAAFEKEFAAAVGAEHAVAVSNCTVALELSLRALGVGPGDEVVTVSHSFVATANAIVTVGATPVFCDVEEDTYGMDPVALRRAIGEKTKAILPVHQIGMPCDMAGIHAVAQEHGLPIIEDAACAIGSEIELYGKWERVGKPVGHAACFSFHPRKIVTTGEGGAVTTDEDELAVAVRRLRHHGITGQPADIVKPGFNYRLPDVLCALGLPQLERLESLLDARERVASWYEERLAHLVGVPRVDDGDRHGWQAYVVTLDRRDEALAGLRAQGIEAQIGTYAVHRLSAYRDRGSFPGADAAFERALALPFAGTMTEDEVDRVSMALSRYV